MFVLLGNHSRERYLSILATVLLAFLREPARTDDPGIGVGFGPGGYGDVVLHVGSDDVGEVAAFVLDLLFDFWSELYWGEDGKGSRGKGDWNEIRTAR